MLDGKLHVLSTQHFLKMSYLGSMSLGLEHYRKFFHAYKIDKNKSQSKAQTIFRTIAYSCLAMQANKNLATL